MSICSVVHVGAGVIFVYTVPLTTFGGTYMFTYTYSLTRTTVLTHIVSCVSLTSCVYSGRHYSTLQVTCRE